MREENFSTSAIAAVITTRFATAVTAAVTTRFAAATITASTAALRTGRAKSAARSFGPVHHRGRTALYHRRTDPDGLLLLLRRRVLTHPRQLPILLRTGKVPRRKLRLLLRSGLLDGLRGPLRSGRAAIESAAIGSSIGST